MHENNGDKTEFDLGCTWPSFGAVCASIRAPAEGRGNPRPPWRGIGGMETARQSPYTAGDIGEPRMAKSSHAIEWLLGESYFPDRERYDRRLGTPGQWRENEGSRVQNAFWLWRRKSRVSGLHNVVLGRVVEVHSDDLEISTREGCRSSTWMVRTGFALCRRR